MNKDQIKGTAKEIGGKIQEEAGKLTGNREQEAKGLGKQVAGKTQKKFACGFLSMTRRVRVFVNDPPCAGFLSMTRFSGLFVGSFCAQCLLKRVRILRQSPSELL